MSPRRHRVSGAEHGDLPAALCMLPMFMLIALGSALFALRTGLSGLGGAG